MVVHRDKRYEQHSLFLNINYTNDLDAYVVDEATEEGKALANKIIDNYPYFDLVIEDGKIVDISVIEIVKPEFASIEEVDNTVVQKIREKYSQDDEFKMINKGIDNAQDVDYLQYRQYVQECKDWGTTKKNRIRICINNIKVV